MMQLYAKAAIALALGVGLPTSVLQDQSRQNQPPAQDSTASQNSESEKSDQSSAEEKKSPDAASQPAGEATSDKADAQPNSGSQTSPNSKSRTNGSRTQRSGGEPRKIVIRRGGVTEPVTQIIPGMTLDESNRLRQEAKDLLTTADSDLKKLASRNLNLNQQETVSQIHHYMDIARSALGDGDIERAHTVARKAQLLSDDLVKH
jgi:hypothetical protein